MATNPYFKSLLWLAGFGGMGYGLLVLTEPNAEKIDRIKASASGSNFTEDERKKALFMKKLQEAATTSKPLYRPQAEAEKRDT